MVQALQPWTHEKQFGVMLHHSIAITESADSERVMISVNYVMHDTAFADNHAIQDAVAYVIEHTEKTALDLVRPEQAQMQYVPALEQKKPVEQSIQQQTFSYNATQIDLGDLTDVIIIEHQDGSLAVEPFANEQHYVQDALQEQAEDLLIASFDHAQAAQYAYEQQNEELYHRYSDRVYAYKQTIKNPDVFIKRTYWLSEQTHNLLAAADINPEHFNTCIGNELQQQLHSEVVTILDTTCDYANKGLQICKCTLNCIRYCTHSQ